MLRKHLFVALFFSLCLSAAQAASFSQRFNDFSLALTAKILKTQPSNIVLFPAGIYSNLATMNSYATNRNRLSALNAMNENSTKTALKELDISMKPFLPELKHANAIWLQQGAPGVRAKPVATLSPTIHFINFKQSRYLACELINHWFDKKADKKPSETLSPSMLLPNTTAVFSSTARFQANWLFAFNDKLTREGVFNAANNKSTKALFMQQKHFFPYYEDAISSLVLLPYQNKEVVLALFMPKIGVTLQTFYAQLTSSRLSDILAKASYQNIDLKLLKPNLDNTSFNPIPALKALGFSSFFEPNQYPALSGKGTIEVNHILQLNELSLNEQGTNSNSGALSGVQQEHDLSPAKSKIPFYTDRPFAMLLLDLKSHVILMSAAVFTP